MDLKNIKNFYVWKVFPSNDPSAQIINHNVEILIPNRLIKFEMS